MHGWEYRYLGRGGARRGRNNRRWLHHVAEQMDSNQRVDARTAKLDTEALRRHDEQVRTSQFASRSSVDVEKEKRAQIHLMCSQSPLLAVCERQICPGRFRFRSWVPRLGYRIWFRRFFSGLDSPYGESALPTVRYEHRATIPDCRHSNHYHHFGAE